MPHARGEQYHPSKGVLLGQAIFCSSTTRLSCKLQEYLHSGWKMLWGSYTALNWSSSISSVLQEQSSYGRQPILLLIAITSQNFPICYFMWFWPPTILEVNFKATSRGSPSSFSLANNDKVSLSQFHLILVTMSMVYTSLLRWQLRWSSIKILHNVAKYTSVVKKLSNYL